MYQPYYCEENVWHLCQTPQFDGWDCRVLFIANSIRCCALWNQKAVTEPGQPIIWDYHVVVLASPSSEKGTWQVWDSDSTLGCPVPLGDYLQGTFGLGSFFEKVPKRFRVRFRMLHSREFIDNFSSDRSHMLSEEGNLLHPPPSWPPINQKGPSNLSQFCDLEAPFLGEVLDLLEVAKIDQ